MHNDLKSLLANQIEHRNSTLLVSTANGRPYKIQGFQSMFFRLIRSLVARQLVQPGLSFHGLRHTVGTKLAEAGCDARTIAAMLGHSTTHMAEHYSRNADRKELVREAVQRLEQRSRNA
ncbi:MAG TPA: tyrosine-type recombinase/integrase [Verrucomicrobiae bacterium]|nr:tyrosine-type recombinase/integrase [Verrucomicrobiae bacterium]